MSASEKLKELNAVLSEPWGRSDPEAYLEEYPEAQRNADLEGVVALRNALPHFVAVVEAAERQAALVVDEEPEFKDEGLPEALEALDEVLSQ